MILIISVFKLYSFKSNKYIIESIIMVTIGGGILVSKFIINICNIQA